MEDLFNFLDKKHLTDHKQIESLVMDKWSVNEILDFNENLKRFIHTPPLIKDDIANFHFVVNSNLSAQEWGPCIEWGCRLRSVDNLSRFSALYADGIYIQDYFDHFEEKRFEIEKLNTRYIFAGNLKILLSLKPLLKSGIVHLVEHPANHICPTCMKSRFPNLSKQLRDIEKYISPLCNHYLSETNVSVSIAETLALGQSTLSVKGPADIFHEGGGIAIAPFETPSWLKRKINRATASKNELNIIELTKNEILKTGLIQRQLHTALEDILLQRMFSVESGLNAKYLTDRNADFLVLNSMTKDNILQNYNNILTNKLLYEIPIIYNAPIEYLLKIRANDYDAFLSFRNSITRIVKEYVVQHKPISQHDAQQIYEDEIYPKICDLNNKVKSIHSFAVKKMFKDMIISASVITIGLFSGIFPEGIREVLTGLGMIKPGKDLSDSIFNVISADDQIRNENLYFLWKIRERRK